MKHILLYSLALAGMLCAQNETAVLVGRVSDPAGLGVPGAQVRLTENATGAIRATQSGVDGFYRFDLLAPGDYSISVTMQGFKTFEDENLHLEVARSSTLDIP